MAGMKKSLGTLIKLQRRELNDLRKQLNVLERQRAQLMEASIKLSEELQNEIEKAVALPEMGSFFGNFSARIQKRQEEIGMIVREIDKKTHSIVQKINEVFSEVKKYEIALENLLRREAEEANRKEQIMLDDMGVDRYSRQMAGDT